MSKMARLKAERPFYKEEYANNPEFKRYCIKLAKDLKREFGINAEDIFDWLDQTVFTEDLVTREKTSRKLYTLGEPCAHSRFAEKYAFDSFNSDISWAVGSICVMIEARPGTVYIKNFLDGFGIYTFLDWFDADYEGTKRMFKDILKERNVNA